MIAQLQDIIHGKADLPFKKVVMVTPSQVTLLMISRSPRFSGKKIIFRHDGTGYKRQGQYIKMPENTAYWKGLLVRYTGESEELHGTEVYEIELLEGHQKGEFRCTDRPFEDN